MMLREMANMNLWHIIEAYLAGGVHASDADLAAAVRQAPIPEPLRDYVASRIDGSWLRKGKGPKGVWYVEDILRESRVLEQQRLALEILYAIYKAQKKKAPREKARSGVAKAWGIEARTLRRDLARRALSNLTLPPTPEERAERRAAGENFARMYLAQPTAEARRNMLWLAWPTIEAENLRRLLAVV